MFAELGLTDGDHGRAAISVVQHSRLRVHLEQRLLLDEELRLPAPCMAQPCWHSCELCIHSATHLALLGPSENAKQDLRSGFSAGTAEMQGARATYYAGRSMASKACKAAPVITASKYSSQSMFFWAPVRPASRKFMTTWV